MPRYIDAISAREKFQDNLAYMGSEVKRVLNMTPTADVEEVVRCKDCNHWGGITYGQICRKYSSAETKVCTEKDHYCSYGERKPQKEGLK